jgi:hypothetical protein
MHFLGTEVAAFAQALEQIEYSLPLGSYPLTAVVQGIAQAIGTAGGNEGTIHSIQSSPGTNTTCHGPVYQQLPSQGRWGQSPGFAAGGSGFAQLGMGFVNWVWSMAFCVTAVPSNCGPE